MNNQNNDKRSRLVEAASRLFHEKGVNTTTLANIAEAADVPLGNVYYYFKSKDSIVLAVVESRRNAIKSLINDIEANNASPRAKLEAFIAKNFANNENIASFGDSLGSLCQELGKQQGALSTATSGIMQDIIVWLEAQFSSLGKADAQKRAVELVSNIQGLNLLTLTFKDPQFAAKQGSFLVENIEA